MTVIITPEQRAQMLAYGAGSAAGKDIDPFPLERKSASWAAHLGGKDLARNLTTLHGQMRKCGLPRYLQGRFFYLR
jgi:hypothetical protein